MTTKRMLDSIDLYFDDFVIGDRFATRSRTITEADIVAFAGLSGDYHPLHTDETFAVNGPFGARVAQGALTLSVASGLEFGLVNPSGTDESKVVAFYGLDRVRFVAPVFIGSTIRVEGEIVALEDKDETRGVITIRQEIKNERDETVVVLDKRIVNRKRPKE